jgi:DNA invertase Pin-like site-specific DNA recombinase
MTEVERTSPTLAAGAKKVVTYSRVSTSQHDQNPDVQVHELRRYCAARGYAVADEIVDHGYGGGTDQRPGLRNLMAMVRRREVDAVVVVKMDRLFRSLKHLVVTLEEFEALGVLFVATKDNVDYSTPSGRLFVQMLGALAEFEKSLVRERTMMGLAHAVAIGKKLGRPCTSDFTQIVKLRTQGLSYREIQRRLGCSGGAINRAITAASKSLPDEHKKTPPETSVEDE